jgi:hypothetical protein
MQYFLDIFVAFGLRIPLSHFFIVEVHIMGFVVEVKLNANLKMHLEAVQPCHR